MAWASPAGSFRSATAVRSPSPAPSPCPSDHRDFPPALHLLDGDVAPVEVNQQSPAAALLDLPPDLEALDDRLLPLPGRAPGHLQVGGQALYGAEQLGGHTLCPFQPV